MEEKFYKTKNNLYNQTEQNPYERPYQNESNYKKDKLKVFSQNYLNDYKVNNNKNINRNNYLNNSNYDDNDNDSYDKFNNNLSQSFINSFIFHN